MSAEPDDAGGGHGPPASAGPPLAKEGIDALVGLISDAYGKAPAWLKGFVCLLRS